MTEQTKRTRVCGTCSACCTWMAIAELDKPAATPCKHLTKVRPDNRCSIYSRRPSACQTYMCAWLQGAFADHMRPDRAGLLVSIYGGTPETISATIFILDERRSGTLQSGALSDFVRDLTIVGINDIKLLNYEQKTMIWLKDGVIRQGKILPADTFEDLKYEAYDPPIGKLRLATPQGESSNDA